MAENFKTVNLLTTKEEAKAEENENFSVSLTFTPISLRLILVKAFAGVSRKEVAMFLFGPVGPTELLLILLIVVIIFGARRLPELGKSLGEGIRNFRKSVSGRTEDEEKRVDKDRSNPPNSKE
jgi:sec-independent protein translocase protein TatA